MNFHRLDNAPPMFLLHVHYDEFHSYLDDWRNAISVIFSFKGASLIFECKTVVTDTSLTTMLSQVYLADCDMGTPHIICFLQQICDTARVMSAKVLYALVLKSSLCYFCKNRDLGEVVSTVSKIRFSEICF